MLSPESENPTGSPERIGQSDCYIPSNRNSLIASGRHPSPSSFALACVIVPQRLAVFKVLYLPIIASWAVCKDYSERGSHGCSGVAGHVPVPRSDTLISALRRQTRPGRSLSFFNVHATFHCHPSSARDITLFYDHQSCH